MTETIVKLRKLQADEGMVLTDGKYFSSVGGFVYPGKNDSADNWRKITESEYNEISKKQEEEEGINVH